MEFVQAGTRGSDELLVTLLEKQDISEETRGYAFREACRNGHLSSAKILYKAEYVKQSMRDACENGHLDIVIWLMELGYCDVEEGFILACKNRHTKIIRCLMDKISNSAIWSASFTASADGNIDVLSILAPRQKGTSRDVELAIAARLGLLELGKWLVSTGDADIHFSSELPFRMACANGNEEFAKWLYEISVSGYRDGENWLVAPGEIDIHAREEDAFVEAAIAGHETIARWLYSLGAWRRLDEEDLLVLERSGNIPFVMWLWNL